MLSSDNLQAYIRKAAASCTMLLRRRLFRSSSTLATICALQLRRAGRGGELPADGVLASLRAVFAAESAATFRVHSRGRTGPGVGVGIRRPGRGRAQPAAGLHPGQLAACGRGPGPGDLPAHAHRRAGPGRVISVQGRSFGEEKRVEPTDAQMEDLRRRSGQGATIFRPADDSPVAAAHTPRRSTGSPSWRGSQRWRIPSPRRGALTAAMAQAAFRAGVRVVFLSAADERAGWVYERVGFQPSATALAFCEAAME